MQPPPASFLLPLPPLIVNSRAFFLLMALLIANSGAVFLLITLLIASKSMDCVAIPNWGAGRLRPRRLNKSWTGRKIVIW